MKLCECKTKLKSDWKFCPTCGKEYKKDIQTDIKIEFSIGTKLEFKDGVYEIYSIRNQYDPKFYFWNIQNEDDQHNIHESGLMKIIKEGICKII